MNFNRFRSASIRCPRRWLCYAAAIGITVSPLLLNGCGSGSDAVTHPNLVGSWGNRDAELDIQSTGVTYTNPCGMVTLNGTITTNGMGDFIITGPVPSNRPLTGQYVGHVRNNTLHLVIVGTSPTTISASEDLTYGTKGNVTFVGCP